MAKVLEPLVIHEAVDGIIKLANVPEGATARIPPGPLAEGGPSVHFFVEVMLNGTGIGERFSGSTPHSETIEIKVARELLLANIGPQGAEFSYRLNLGGNSQDARFTKYEITH